MKTLLIDNYDSFTFNLAQLVAEVTGELPQVVKNDVAWAELAGYEADCIIVSPGPGWPGRRDDFGVCRQVILESALPILGVCLGHQGIAHLSGGRVVHASEPMHGRLSAVHHDGRELFAGLPQGFAAVRYHSLVVAEPMPASLERTAWTVDGVLMGLRHRTRPQWGVQFHPESIASEHGRQLVANFLALAAERGPQQGSRRVGGPAATKPDPQPRARRAATPARPRYRLVHRRLELSLETERVFTALYARSEHAFWLDSSRLEGGPARFSFLGDRSGPLSHVLVYDLAAGTVQQDGQELAIAGVFADLEQRLAGIACRSDELPFDFQCGYVGYLGYELKAECGGARAHVSPLPDAQLLLADRLIAFDHREGGIYLVALARDGHEPAAQAGEPRDGADPAGAADDGSEAAARRWLDRIERALAALAAEARSASSSPSSDPAGTHAAVELRLRRGRASYLDSIRRCQAWLREGESYEVCLTTKVVGACELDPLELYRQLRVANPAPYAAYLRLGGLAIACSSPERFLRLDRERWVESRPIKGTAARGATTEQDEASLVALRSGEKSRAENLMIVDLVRNDLGAVCDVGTVHVPDLMRIESFATVHQLVSTVRGHLRDEVSALGCVRAAFPGGSMTGAPKRRTMQLLDELEGEARGIYSGSIGYLSCSGALDLNIVIRTAVLQPGQVSIGTGGAIVALSEPVSELEEILLKVGAIAGAIQRVAGGAAAAPVEILEPAGPRSPTGSTAT